MVLITAKVITFAHYKGGTGKTTSCINIAGFLQKKGFLVLVIDLDPQGNLTSGIGIVKKTVKHNMYVVMKGKDIRHAILKSSTEGIHIAPADLNLIRATIIKYKSKKDAMILKETLTSVKDYYDFILIDAPPSNGHFIVNSVSASNLVVLVLDSGVFALEGIESFKNIFTEYGKRLKFDVNIGMALINKYKSSLFFNKDYGREIGEEVKEVIDRKVFMVPYSNTVLESQLRGLPISHFRPWSNIGRTFNKVTEELLNLVKIKNG